jgi:hypothetical protein
VVTNTFGATTTDPAAKPNLTCQSGTPDPNLGCTASAHVTARAGNAIDAQKWVHGDDALGFFNTRTGQTVTVGDASCPLLTRRCRRLHAVPLHRPHAGRPAVRLPAEYHQCRHHPGHADPDRRRPAEARR